MKVDRGSHGSTESWWKITEDSVDAWKVTQMHRQLTKINGRFRRKESYQKLTEVLANAWKVDGSWRKFLQMYSNLTEVPVDERKIDESWRKVQRTVEASWRKVPLTYGMYDRRILQKHGKVTEVDWRSRRRMKNLTEIVVRSHGGTEHWWKLTDSPLDAQKMDRRWRKDPWTHVELTVVYGRSRACMQSCQKLMIFLRLHEDLSEIDRRNYPMILFLLFPV